MARTSEQLYHGKNKSTAISWQEQVKFWWNNDDVRFVLEQHVELDLYSVRSLKQQSTARDVPPLRHIILIPSQPVFALTS
jgi:hypothetical protein